MKHNSLLTACRHMVYLCMEERVLLVASVEIEEYSDPAQDNGATILLLCSTLCIAVVAANQPASVTTASRQG
jgi:hypothetical protein